MKPNRAILAVTGVVVVIVLAIWFGDLSSPSNAIVDGDWRESLKRSVNADLAQVLRMSKVPDEAKAGTLAMAAFPGQDNQHAYRSKVTALFRLPKDDQTLGQADDFIWEVRVISGDDVRGIVLVDSKTGKASMLYPR